VAFLEKYLRIKKSLLPDAGKGLFTKVEILKGTRIAEYKGKKRKWVDAKHEDGYNGYLMRVTRSVVIDALPATHTFGRYANDARGLTRVETLKNNAEYISEGTRCYIDATRNIKAGEEIFVSYGREYWTLMRKIFREKSKRK
jgi:SET domain-containing protein